VHAFRTVVADNGAHVGLLISKVGFQSGAYRAAESSNIHLYTWNDFQEAYEVLWTNSIALTIRRLGYRLNCYLYDPHKSENWSGDYFWKWKKFECESQSLCFTACQKTDSIMSSTFPVQLLHPDVISHPNEDCDDYNGEEWINVHSKRLEYIQHLVGPHPDFKEERYVR